jgi:CheY-like chemotaxis protein
VDLVLCDVIMPGGIDGVAVTRELQGRVPPIPVLLTSGYSGYDAEQVEEPALRAALQHLLRKPFSRSELAHAVRETLTRFSEGLPEAPPG